MKYEVSRITRTHGAGVGLSSQPTQRTVCDCRAQIFTWVTLPLSVMTIYLNRSSQAILENQLGINSHNVRLENIFNIWCTDDDKWIMREKVRSTLSLSKCALWETEEANLICVKNLKKWHIQYHKGFIKHLGIMNLFIIYKFEKVSAGLREKHCKGLTIWRDVFVLWLFSWKLISHPCLKKGNKMIF